ncbi:hypothetical protein CABS01_11433, partial [Colletotrichum abscissum]|uniref:uncharacterized protein n=1 Tax=Colletotrichum abscissum TaxID=1671311 RepID=UPI0027D6CD02
ARGNRVLKVVERTLGNLYTGSLSVRLLLYLVRSPGIEPRDSGMDGPEFAKEIKPLPIRHGLVHGEVAEEAVVAIGVEDETEDICKRGPRS